MNKKGLKGLRCRYLVILCYLLQFFVVQHFHLCFFSWSGEILWFNDSPLSNIFRPFPVFFPISPLQARTSGLGTFFDFSLRNLSFPFLLQIWTFIFAVSKAVTSPSLTVTPLSSQSQSARQELIQNAAWMRDKYYQRTGGQGLTSKPRGTRGGMAALSRNLGKLVRLVVLWDPGAAGWLLAHPGLTGARKTAAFMQDRGSRPESKAGTWTLDWTVDMRYVKLRG